MCQSNICHVPELLVGKLIWVLENELLDELVGMLESELVGGLVGMLLGDE